MTQEHDQEPDGLDAETDSGIEDLEITEPDIDESQAATSESAEPTLSAPFEQPEQSEQSNNGGFALLAVALLVLVGGSVFFVGKLLNQQSETDEAQASAEAAIADFDFDTSGVPITIPDELLLADDTEPIETVEEDAQPADAESTPTTVVAQPSVNPADIALAFVNRVPGDEYGMVGYIDNAGERHVTELECDRVDLNEAGGICLSDTAGLAGTGRGLLLTPDLNPTTRFGVSSPSRAAVSPDGAVVAWTGFTLGHSYLDEGEFATTTQLISVERGIAADLETIFSAFGTDGTLIDDIDRNYWGVSFVDSDLFYATLGSGGTTSIVEGRVSTSRLDVVYENGSCPEISPDGSKIVFKEQRGDAFQLVMVDTATGARSDLAETRSVDDQVEWIDDSTILYGVANTEEGTDAQPVFDVYALNVDDGSAPQLIIPFADSPAS